MPQPVKKNHRYISGLDGLRALSVLGVILYHLHLQGIAGGYLGVTVFFVLSGYLITDLLINEFETKGSIDFKSFWIRRFRRLLPALFLMLILVCAWVTIFQRDFLVGLRGEVLAAFFYVSNWFYVVQDHSYFTQFAPPSPLQHMWSLAVEEQFYLVWPIIMFILLKFFPNRGKVAFTILLLSVVSAELMAFMFTPGVDPSRVYYGTDTRAFSLLIGAAMALIWPSRRLKSHVTRELKRTLNIIGMSSFIILIVMMIFMKEDGAFLYYGGMYLASAVTAVLIGTIVHPASMMGKVFSWKPLLWIGVRSYGIYIWHFPIIVLLGIGVDTGDIHWPKAMLAFVLTLVLAELSWRFIEDPIRKGKLKQWLPFLKRNIFKKRIKYWSMKSRLAFIGTLAILIVFFTGMIMQPPSDAAANKEIEKHLLQEQQNLKEKDSKEKAMSEEEKVEAKEKSEQKTKEAAEKAKAQAAKEQRIFIEKFEQKAAAAKEVVKDLQVTAVGDSVMLSASTPLQSYMPNVKIDANVGRQVDEAIDVLREKAKKGTLKNTVLIGIGSNGTFKQSQWQEIYKIVGPTRKVYLINTRVPRSWQKSVNKTITAAAKAHGNVYLVDWYKASGKRDDIFYKDQIHPNVVGGDYYAGTVAITIANTIQSK